MHEFLRINSCLFVLCLVIDNIALGLCSRASTSNHCSARSTMDFLTGSQLAPSFLTLCAIKLIAQLRQAGDNQDMRQIDASRDQLLPLEYILASH